MTRTGQLYAIDEDVVIGQLISHARTKKFRSAWNYMKNNVDPDHVRFYDAGVVIQHLSDRYGDIGELKDDCILKKQLEYQVTKIVELLI